MQINAIENEVVGAGQVLLVLADTTQWFVETDDLNEMEIIQISENQLVNLMAEAYPGEQFSGLVSKISDVPVFKQGDVLYTVRIQLAMNEIPNLKWGMTVTAEFE